MDNTGFYEFIAICPICNFLAELVDKGITEGAAGETFDKMFES